MMRGGPKPGAEAMNDLSSSSAGVPKLHIRLGPDTDGTAAALYRQFTELLYTLTFAPGAEARFRYHSVTYQFPRAAVASAESVAQTLSRGPAEIARGGGNQILIWIQVSGESDVNYAGREGKLRPGDVVVLDYEREIFVRAPDFASIFVMIERNMVPPIFLAPSMHGTIFAADSGPGRILYRGVESLFQILDRLTLAEANAALDALITLTAGMLEGDLARRAADVSSSDPLLDRALAFIDANLAMSDLAPALLEKNLALSRSGLYRLFEPLGGVRNAILHRRLERAVRVLLTSTAAKPPLRSIASDHGFSSEEQYSRAFRARFGTTPYQFFDMVRRKDTEAIAAQAERFGFSSLSKWIKENMESEPDRVPQTSAAVGDRSAKPASEPPPAQRPVANGKHSPSEGDAYP
jgi:AraC-like DNA-binding protein